jgi:hypothetical protein
VEEKFGGGGEYTYLLLVKKFDFEIAIIHKISYNQDTKQSLLYLVHLAN